MDIIRLEPGHEQLARDTFEVMSDVFAEEPWTPLGNDRLQVLLTSPGVWLYAAVEKKACIGGLTAHLLPMTRAEVSEVLIYDLAVRTDRQRRGVGRALIERLRVDAAAADAGDVWVPADNDDDHALEFYRSIGGEPQDVTIFTFPRVKR